MTGKQLLIGALVLLNIILAGVLADRVGFQTAAAQAQGFGGVGHYAVVSGNNTTGGIVYVYDEDAGVLSGLITPYNSTTPQYIIPRNILMDINRSRSRTP
jgi:hypothetical protein